MVEGHQCDLLARHTGPHYHHSSHHGRLRPTAVLTLPVHVSALVCEEWEGGSGGGGGGRVVRIQEDTRECVLFILSFKPSYILVEGHYCDLLLARHTGPHYHHNSHHGLLQPTPGPPVSVLC